jgi:hypothetical protein
MKPEKFAQKRRDQRPGVFALTRKQSRATGKLNLRGTSPGNQSFVEIANRVSTLNSRSPATPWPMICSPIKRSILR